jgi:catechol 2,3-dioxygenase-like lactoylglutathione lyase family enzyme
MSDTNIINHIAVNVCDLDQAIKWYKEVLGFTMVAGPVEFVADDSLIRSIKRYSWSRLKENASGLARFR